MTQDALPPRAIGLNALIVAAARDCPGALLFGDAAGGLTARMVAERVDMLAMRLRQCGLRRGERILLVAGAETRAVIGLIAALRAGLEPALAPCGLGPIDLAAYARAAKAVALVGPTHYGSLALGDPYLSAAAVSDSIRLIATLGPEVIDGAVDLEPSAPSPVDQDALSSDPEGTTILTFEGKASAPIVVSHKQATLFTLALTLVDQAQMNPSRSILSTFPPSSLAGLVAGPFAALIGAANLILHGPFEAKRFLDAYDAFPGAHLVVPEMIAPLVDEAGLLDRDEGALILIGRHEAPTSFMLPEPLACQRAIVDLHALGETTLIIKRRQDGQAVVPPELYDGSVPGRLGVALNRAVASGRANAGD